MNLDLLQDVVDALKNKSPDVVFDMRTWARTNCQTSACAIGCYCLANPDIELKLVHSKMLTTLNSFHEENVLCMVPAFRKERGFYALVDYFNINFFDIRFLFDGERTIEQEIEVLTYFIDTKGQRLEQYATL